MVRGEAGVTVPPDGPNWRDHPAELDQLCDEGARRLYGPQPEHRDIRTLEPPEEYL